MKEITVDATLENVGIVTAFVDELLEQYSCPMRAQCQIDVAIDELFSNVARYAYNPDTGPVSVSVEVEQSPLQVVITFADGGVPYDPTSHEDPDVTAGIEERAVGGLGILLVKNTMDEVIYEHKDGKNILRIRKEM